MSALIAHYNRRFWIPAGTNKDDLECPIHLKVRFTDGTLIVRMLRLSDSIIRISVVRGGRGEWAGGLSLLPPCGQLTRCFSAVAELLVIYHTSRSRSRQLQRLGLGPLRLGSRLGLGLKGPVHITGHMTS